jgi:hypothetical protein
MLRSVAPGRVPILDLCHPFLFIGTVTTMTRISAMLSRISFALRSFRRCVLRSAKPSNQRYGPRHHETQEHNSSLNPQGQDDSSTLSPRNSQDVASIQPTPESRPTPFDIGAVLHLLSSPTSPLGGRLPLLPRETTLAILDLAEYWQPLRGSLAHARVTYDDDDGDTVRLLVPAFPAHSALARAIQCVEVRVVSYSEGRSSDDEAGAWFELALLNERKREVSARFQVVDEEHASTGEGIARSGWREGRIVWGPDHPLVRHVRPGQHVALFTRADAPMWVHYVCEVEVTVYLRWP